MVYHESKKKYSSTYPPQINNWVEKWEECHHTLPKIGGDTMQE